MRLEGTRIVPGTPASLWSRLGDLGFLVRCIPDRAKAEIVSPDRATVVVRPGFAFVRGTLDIVLERTCVQPMQEMRLAVASRAIGSSADLEVELKTHAEGDSVRFDWSATVVRLGGLLKAVPSGLLRAAAQKVIEDVLANLERELTLPPPEDQARSQV